MPDMEVYAKRKYFTELLHAEKLASIDINQNILNSGCKHSEVLGCVSPVMKASMCHLCFCKFLGMQHAGSCSLHAKMRS